MGKNAGEIVELAVRRQNVNISQLSRTLNVNRRTLYNWFKQEKLHSDVIVLIGKAINYDFSNDFEYCPSLSGNKSGQQVQKSKENSLTSDEAYYWMEKYVNLLEEYKKLLDKRNWSKSAVLLLLLQFLEAPALL